MTFNNSKINHPKIRHSPILIDYHINRLKEHDKMERILLAEQRKQKKLRELYEKATKKKRREELKKKITPRPRGRPRVSFDYETAKEIVRGEGIRSLVQYQRWHQMNKPKRLPAKPERSYKEVWTGWGDFLGVYNNWSNQSGEKHIVKYRAFEDARMFARSLGLKTTAEWLKYTNSGKCPLDIPHRPEIVYGKGKRKEYWLSWKDFLGYKIQTTMDRIVDVSPVLYIGRQRQNGSNINVYIINTIPGGKAALEHHIQNMQILIVRAYYIDGKFDKKSFMAMLQPYPYGTIDEYMISNIYEVIEYLDNELEKVV